MKEEERIILINEQAYFFISVLKCVLAMVTVFVLMRVLAHDTAFSFWVSQRLSKCELCVGEKTKMI